MASVKKNAASDAGTMLILLLIFFCPAVSPAQTTPVKYTEAKALIPLGKALPTAGNLFIRLDSLQNKNMPPKVRELSQNSAGVAFLFESNTTTVSARWKTAKKVYAANMTPIAHSGLDLYCFAGGKWQYVGVGRPQDKTAQEQVIIGNMKTGNRQFMLYCPLYNSLDSLSVGVDAQAYIRKPAKPEINTTTRVVMYGSSILQGASASRPGMAYPAILSRRTGWDVINLGFSGNAKMEIELAEYLVKVPASVYVLDCVPNPTPDEVRQRSYPFVKYLLDHKKGTPVVMIESVHREIAYWDEKWKKRLAEQNRYFRETYQRLKKEGYTNLYYIPSEGQIGSDHEATIDGTHFTDLGFMRMADKVMPVLQQAIRNVKAK